MNPPAPSASTLLLHAAAPLGVLAFWIGVVTAALHYPSEFDWRYMTLSSVLYPTRNPEGYRLAWAGIAACSVAGWAWAEALVRAGPEPRPQSLHATLLCLRIGFACMLCCAIVPGRLLPTDKGHEALALTAFVTLCAALVRLSYTMAQQWLARRTSSARSAGRAWAMALASVPLAPVVLAALTQAYLAFAHPELPWVTLAWRARGIPVVLSFALWEWLTCAVFSVFVIGLALVASVGRNYRGYDAPSC